MTDEPTRAWIVGGLVAVGGGLLIGLERERRKGRGPARNAAGIRTFTLAALAGALAQGLGQPLLVAAGAVAVLALAALAYWRSASRDPGLTTELALFVTYLIGVLSMVTPALGAAAAAIVTALLAARSKLHHFATRMLSEAELHDALLLAALALVVVPLVPDVPVTALGGLRPQALMGLVLLILALQAAGHVALRLFGVQAGLVLSGLFSGFVSSTATIASMGARARHHPAQARDCRSGAAMSTASTWVQGLVMLVSLSPNAAQALLPVAAVGATAATVTALGLLLWPPRQHTAAPPQPRVGLPESTSPAPPDDVLRIREAAIVATLITVVTLGVTAAQRTLGHGGLLGSLALAGLAEAHSGLAALAALAQSGHVDTQTVVLGVLTAFSANGLTRGVTAFVAGGCAFGAAVSGSLLLSTGCAWIAMLLLD